MKLEFDIASGDFGMAGKASSQIKKMLKQLQVEPKVIKRIVVAIYEAEVNIVAHSVGGKLLAEIDESGISVVVKDEGPGIEDIKKAMQEGFSTASKAVRNMGFGAGMGLPNIKKNTDEFQIESEVGKGTTLTFRNNF
ncbi:ATP-binding protein [uncultured Draconibacterium sp.]|uniref:ATP-binding protein n=1 Tax=uncultured Draconibacterium sp. TaxID=1573823 RepID=UPI0025EA973A|nr:ATP-binding protein [uncultured Draconibacterium sp.]